MENPQENQQNAGKLELVFNLSHSARNQLIISLSDLSIILQSSKPITENAKQRIRKMIGESVHLLMDLSPFKPSLSTSGLFERMLSGRLMLELSAEKRLRVTSHLIAAGDAVQFDGLVTDETKRNLAAENRRIIVQLLDLLCREQSGRADDENNNESLSIEQMVDSELTGLNEAFDWRVFSKQQEEQISSLKTRIDELKNDLRRRVKEVDINRQEASFKFKLAGVSEFFETDGKGRYSDRFWCRGLLWSLYVACHLQEDRSKHLSFFLHCHNNDPVKWWSCKTDYDLILFSNLSEKENRVYESACIFNKRTGYGRTRFISYLELTDEKNGYIKDDMIVLGVELKAGPVIRL